MEVPSIREELSRKALNTLQSLLIDRERGVLTEAQFGAALNVLWDTVSGLVDREFMDLISMVKVNKNDPSYRRRTMLVCREHWILTTVDPVALSVTVHRDGGSQPAEFMCDTIEEALTKARKIHEKAGLSGYTIIN